MLPRKSGRRSIQAGFGVSDQLHRHVVHHALETALGNETVAEARTRQMIAQPVAQAAADHRGVSPLRESEITSNGAERQAKTVERGRREAIRTVPCGFPKRPLLVELYRSALDRSECFVDIQQPATGNDPLDRHATEALAQTRENLVFKTVERSKVDVPAFRFDHLIIAVTAKEGGHSETGAGTQNGNHALLGQKLIGTADPFELILWKGGHGMSDSTEIIDDGVAVDAEPLLHQSLPDHPRIVGELEHLSANRPGEGHRQLGRQIDPLPPPELLPGGLEARMLRSLELHRFAERDDAAGLDLGEREARLGSADVGRNDRPHACSASIAASIAEAPSSASLAVVRISAKSS